MKKCMIVLASVLASVTLFADYHWKGGVSSNWGDAGNWEENTVPPTGSDIVINANAVRVGDRDIGTTMTVGNLTVKCADFRWSYATVTILGNLTVEENCRFYGNVTTLVFPEGEHAVTLGVNSSQEALWLNGTANLLDGSGTVVVDGGGNAKLTQSDSSVPFSGKLVVKGGEFQVYNHVFPNISEIEIDGSTAKFRTWLSSGTIEDAFNTNVVLKFANGGMLYPNGSRITQHVRQIWIDGTQRSSGIWGYDGCATAEHFAAANIKSAAILTVSEGDGLPGGDEDIVYHWKGGTSSNWGDASNWEENVVPPSGADVEINSDSVRIGDRDIGTTMTVGNLTVKRADFRWSGSTVTINGNLTIEDGCRFYSQSTTLVFPEGRHDVVIGQNNSGYATIWLNGDGDLLSGPGTVVVSGTGDITLSDGTTTSPVPFSGKLVMKAGYLQCRLRPLPNISEIEIDGPAAVLRAYNANDFINHDAVMKLSNGGKYDAQTLPRTQYVKQLWVDGIQRRAGTYTYRGGSAPHYFKDNLMSAATIIVLEGDSALPAGDVTTCVYDNAAGDWFWGNAANWTDGLTPAGGDTVVVSNGTFNAPYGTMYMGTSSTAPNVTLYVGDLRFVGAGGVLYRGNIIVGGDISYLPTEGISAQYYYIGGGSGSGIEFLQGRHVIDCTGMLGTHNSAKISGSGTLVKTGVNKFWVNPHDLPNPTVHTFTGNLDVVQGLWEFRGDDQMSGLTNLTVRGTGASVIFNDPANIGADAEWTIDAGSEIYLPAGKTFTAKNITIKGKGLHAGVYGSASSPAPRKRSVFTGTGVVEVTEGAPYDSGFMIQIR